MNENSKELEKENTKQNNIQKSNEDEKKPEIPLEQGMLEKLPPEVKRVIQLTSSSYSGSFPSANLPDLTEKHVDKLLEMSENDDIRRFKDTQRSRTFGITYTLIGVAVFVFRHLV